MKLLTCLALLLASTALSAQNTYTFIGNGNWSQVSNWQDNLLPPSTLPPDCNIVIRPQAGGKCILDVLQIIVNGASLKISDGAIFVVSKNVGMISELSDTLGVKIGNQYWTRRNLNITRYRNGDSIPHVTDANQWRNLKSGAWCYYNNDPSSEALYGKLYNWYAVTDPRGLAPDGWHIPAKQEWAALTGYLSGEFFAGGQLKAVSSLWQQPNTSANDFVGFSALPGGYRDAVGRFYSLKQKGGWWSTTGTTGENAMFLGLSYDSRIATSTDIYKEFAYSVRCLKD
ncbi:fibrobacter succinogenes major paralogous domain-containing protein [Foetidibacter luteolus]|uniref:fibrobacter succinogenes major paralogous domain-containing protein n=1 Tax=Foetidibacter luteolus TaxID=2608880 RepID=UPI00129B1AE8|nr:fibrobacter succinogenes major paralogous domain-containing protein [Foetidibacter luteolus]